jgi:hypothetical protein
MPKLCSGIIIIVTSDLKLEKNNTILLVFVCICVVETRIVLSEQECWIKLRIWGGQLGLRVGYPKYLVKLILCEFELCKNVYFESWPPCHSHTRTRAKSIGNTPQVFVNKQLLHTFMTQV